MESILALDIPYLPPFSITTSYAINRQVLSHLYWDTSPFTPTSVLVTIPAYGTGSCDGGCNFLEAYWILNQEHVEPHLMEDYQHMFSVGPIGRPSST